METKKEKIVSAVATIGIVLMLFGATYAYFVSEVDAGKITDVEITANTVDVFSFEMGDPISISLDQDNFASGKGNQVGSTFVKATLSANNETNLAMKQYFVYLNIEPNSFDYTQEDKTPEVLLQIFDKNGNEVTSLTDLEYKTVIDGSGETVKGFDITAEFGLYALVEAQEISTENIAEDTWNVNIVFVNLDANQNKNTGKSMKASVIITEEVKSPILLSNYVKSLYTGVQGENNVYYHNGTILAHDGTVLDATDYSYRYAGSSDGTNNFVCFGSNAEVCPNDNLYRIIGVFDGQVKLIKYDYATSDLLGTDGDYDVLSCPYQRFCGDIGNSGTTLDGYYYWNKVNYDSNDSTSLYWNNSALNKVNLNTNYLNNIGVKWSEKISMMTKLIKASHLSGTNAHDIYQEEVNVDASETAYETEAKVWLMYVSDLIYASETSKWDMNLCSANNETGCFYAYSTVN